MLRSIAKFGFVIGLVSCPIQAQTPKAPSPNPELRGEWHRTGPSFACQVVSTNKLQPPDPDQLIFACQRMGSVSVGISEAAMIATFGQPHRKLPQPENAVANVYFLGQPEQLPYLVAVVKAGRVVALQATGDSPVAAGSFNRVNLGDSTEKLRAQFGNAFNVGPSGLAGTDLWNYGPWPFSFEVKNERVTSIRITDPTAKSAK